MAETAFTLFFRYISNTDLTVVPSFNILKTNTHGLAEKEVVQL